MPVIVTLVIVRGMWYNGRCYDAFMHNRHKKKGIGSNRMKKKTLGLLAAVLSVAMLTGCGAKDTGETTGSTSQGTTDSVVLKDLDVDKYVTLGEYKGLEASVDTVEVDEDEWNTMVNNVYYGNITADNGGIVDRAVETGDTVNIDYEGKKDGVAFDGGTDQGYDLTIGSGQFIDGFEDGLIGVMPGETVDLDLTFPEAYGNADLAGQAVVFTVTVNYIQPAQDGELSDEIISNFGIDGVTNEEELRQYAYDYLNENAQQNYESNVQQAVMDAFMAGNTFSSVPEALVQKYSDAAESSITSMASAYGVDGDTFTQYYYGQDLDSFLSAYSEEAAKQDIALQAVANKENLNISDEELDQMLQDRATAAGYDTIDEYIGETSKEDYREYFLYDKVMDYLVENARITNN